MAIGSDFLSSITGNIDKACITVHDAREYAEKLEMEINQMGNFGNDGGSIGPATKEQILTKLALSAVEEDALTASVVSSAYNADKRFFVQFNPSSISLSSSNESVNKRDTTSTNEDQNGKNDIVKAPSVILSVELIFDEMNIYDAFMFDKMTSGVSATTATNTAAMASDKVFSVQPYIEGLISAIRNPYTRAVTFTWADFSFRGMLQGLNAKYTMFSVSGRPIRGVVMLQLKQDQTNTEKVMWQRQLNAFLEQKSSLASAGQKVGNLLNLSL